MDFSSISRRRLLQGSAALTLGTALGARTAAAADTTIGFIYVGSRDDYGYNQAHAAAATALKKMPGIKIVEEEKVPETVAVEKSMESMINLDGATLLFPTSFGYFDPHMLKEAAKFPKIQFRHCGGLWTEGKHPMNTGSYFGYIDEAQYLAGIVAGATTKSGKLGFVAAKPIPQVLRNIMRDEVRHCGFGWAYLEHRIPQMTRAEIDNCERAVITMIRDVEMNGYHSSWLAPESEATRGEVEADRLTWEAGLGATVEELEKPVFVESVKSIRERLAPFGIAIPMFEHPKFAGLV